jgi:hypothetical protein
VFTLHTYAHFLENPAMALSDDDSANDEGGEEEEGQFQAKKRKTGGGQNRSEWWDHVTLLLWTKTRKRLK